MAALLLLEYAFLFLFFAVLSRSPQAKRLYDLVPFWSYRAVQAGKSYVLTSIIANVVAFIPFGLLLGCTFGRMKWWKVLLIGGGFSVLIEVLQFVFQRGFSEFDDVFHNAVGCLIGYGVYTGVRWIVKKVREKKLLGKELV